MARPWCKHYKGMHEKDRCEAGVLFSSLEHHGTKEFFNSCPCFGPKGSGRCDKKEYPTAEEIAKIDAAVKARFENTDRARAAIVSYLGGSWKRGMKGSSGTIQCPICGAEESLRFSRSGYNGHIHASCKTKDCVRWME